MDTPPATSSNAELARINTRIVACFESTTTLVLELLSELSTPQPSEPPTLLRIARTRIRPDKVDEWKAIVTRDREAIPATDSPAADQDDKRRRKERLTPPEPRASPNRGPPM